MFTLQLEYGFLSFDVERISALQIQLKVAHKLQLICLELDGVLVLELGEREALVRRLQFTTNQMTEDVVRHLELAAHLLLLFDLILLRILQLMDLHESMLETLVALEHDAPLFGEQIVPRTICLQLEFFIVEIFRPVGATRPSLLK